MNRCCYFNVNYNGWYSDFIVGPNGWMAHCSRCILLMRRVQERRLWEGRAREKRAAHKQGLQRALASINQLGKEKERNLHIPPPVWERGREKGEGGDWISSQEPWHGWEREWEGDFQRRKRRSSFLNGLNRARMKEEENVGEGSVREEKEV